MTETGSLQDENFVEPVPSSRPKARPIKTAQGLKVQASPTDQRIAGEFTYSVIEATPSKVTLLDKRRAERLRTRLRTGALSDRRNKVIVDCLLQDRSRSGARLRLALDRPLPRVFLLSDHITQTQFWAHLAWQRGRDAGVKLIAL